MILDAIIRGIEPFQSTMLVAAFAGIAGIVASAVVGTIRVRSARIPFWPFVVFACLLYVFVFGTLAVRRHEALQSNAYDLAIFDQALWNTSQLRPFSVSIKADDLAQPILLGDHFSPAIATLAPVYWLFGDVRSLLIAQTILLALAAIPVYRVARDAGRWAAVTISVAYLLVPTLHFTNLYDFHEVALATPALAFAAEALVRRWRKSLVGWLVFATLCKEEIGFVTMAFGLSLLMSGTIDAIRRRPAKADLLMGAGLAIGGFAWAVLAVIVIIPFFEGSGNFTYVNRYGDLGETPVAIVQNLLTNPGEVLSRLSTPERVVFVLSFFVPFALLPLAAPEIAILAVPTFGYLLLSSYAAQYSLGRQYGVFLIPLLAIAAGVGWKRVAGLFPVIGFALGLTVLFAAGGVYEQFSPGPFGASFDAARYIPSPRLTTAQRLFARIPHTASVSAQENLAPHLSRRERLYLFPSLHGAEWIMLDNFGGTYPVDRGGWDAAVADLLRNPLYESVEQADGFALFRLRGSVPGIATNLKLGESLTLIAVNPEPDAIGLVWRIENRESLGASEGLIQEVRLLSPAGTEIGRITKPPRAAGGYWENGYAAPGEITYERLELPPGITGQTTLDIQVIAVASNQPLVRSGVLPIVALR